jgi:hypothetical protein
VFAQDATGDTEIVQDVVILSDVLVMLCLFDQIAPLFIFPEKS